jgi:hypothetical protein
MIILPEEYIAQKFFQHAGAPKHNRFNKTYVGSCPICREGKSWLKKQRCYYIPKNNNIYCHNCGWSSTPLSWIQEVTRMSILDIKKELENYSTISLDDITTEKKEIVQSSTLPEDCINLFDEQQVEYYKDETVVIRALEFIEARRLKTSCNKPKALYVSLTDPVHKNRLVIPFFDKNNKIVHYQTRTILAADNKIKPRYISKINSEKTIFNIDQINDDNEVFIFEGPFNSCFVKNGIAVAGIQDESEKLFSMKQQDQINSLLLKDFIWVLDSQWIDQAAKKKSQILAKNGETLFIWPESVGKKIKDFNDLAITLKINEIPKEFIKKNSYKGLAAEIRLKAMY